MGNREEKCNLVGTTYPQCRSSQPAGIVHQGRTSQVQRTVGRKRRKRQYRGGRDQRLYSAVDEELLAQDVNAHTRWLKNEVDYRETPLDCEGLDGRNSSDLAQFQDVQE